MYSCWLTVFWMILITYLLNYFVVVIKWHFKYFIYTFVFIFHYYWTYFLCFNFCYCSAVRITDLIDVLKQLIIAAEMLYVRTLHYIHKEGGYFVQVFHSSSPVCYCSSVCSCDMIPQSKLDLTWHLTIFVHPPCSTFFVWSYHLYRINDGSV